MAIFSGHTGWRAFKNLYNLILQLKIRLHFRCCESAKWTLISKMIVICLRLFKVWHLQVHNFTHFTLYVHAQNRQYIYIKWSIVWCSSDLAYFKHFVNSYFGKARDVGHIIFEVKMVFFCHVLFGAWSMFNKSWCTELCSVVRLAFQ